MRGIGFNESSLGAKPNVSVYVDEVPLAFPIVTAGAALDLERVEILKGPQGTLFGQNSTGGAISYIAAKPTNQLEAGVNAEYGRFNEANLEGFVSGPFSDSVRGRIAVKSEQSDGWQKSYTTGRKLGDKDKLSGRALLEWTPTDVLQAQLTLSGYRDQSDNQAAQHIAVTPLAPSRIGLIPDIVAYPLSPRDSRAADWGPDDSYGRDNDFYQGALRVDYSLPNDLVLTAISAYSEYDQTSTVDADGLTVQNLEYISAGDIRSFSQELRLAGVIGERAHWIVGANYADDKVKQRDSGFNGYNTNSYA
ncbi:MAG: TonB-dependent receptor plug domain-containing protein, partial [Steroidobacteraceae bacterium]